MKTVLKVLGASNHVDTPRESFDFYATPKVAVDFIIEAERFTKEIWEPACGIGNISLPLLEAGYNVRSSDLIDRNKIGIQHEVLDFFTCTKWHGDIITNPPYTDALQFVSHAINIIPNGNKVAMFLRLLFLETKSRKTFFLEHPPKRVYISASRLACAKNGNFNALGKGESVGICYAWFVWEKGFKGNPQIHWWG